MPTSPYVRRLPESVGTARLLLPSVSVHVFDDQHRLLLVRQVDGDVWSTPGGVIEPGAPAARVRTSRIRLADVAASLNDVTIASIACVPRTT